MYVQTPKSDVYVALLGVSLAAMLIACILLLLVWKRYDFKTKAAFAPAVQTSPTALAGNSGKLSTIHL